MFDKFAGWLAWALGVIIGVIASMYTAFILFVTIMTLGWVDLWAGALSGSYYFRHLPGLMVTLPWLGTVNLVAYGISATTSGINMIIMAEIAKHMRKSNTLWDAVRQIVGMLVGTWYGASAVIMFLADVFLFDLPGVPMMLGADRPGYYIPAGETEFTYLAVFVTVLIFTIVNDPMFTFAIGKIKEKAEKPDFFKRIDAPSGGLPPKRTERSQIRQRSPMPRDAARARNEAQSHSPYSRVIRQGGRDVH